MNKLLAKFILGPFILIYLCGFTIFEVYFNWKYFLEHSFKEWILLGEIVPTLQSTIWPYYAAKYVFLNDSNVRLQQEQQQAAQPLEDGQVIAAFREKAWWLSDYPRLNAALDKAGGSLSTSYRVGPKDNALVQIRIERGADKSLILKIDLPPEAMIEAAPKIGKPQSANEGSSWVYRDHNLDGVPDDVLSKFHSKKIPKDSFTDDGFMIIRDSSYYSEFFILWTVGLSFSTNHFLYGKDSTLPPARAYEK